LPYNISLLIVTINVDTLVLNYFYKNSHVILRVQSAIKYHRLV